MTKPLKTMIQVNKHKRALCQHCGEEIYIETERPLWAKVITLFLPLRRYQCTRCLGYTTVFKYPE